MSTQMQTSFQQIVKNSSDPNLIERALEFARTAHQGQKRSSGEDYIHHPLEVAKILGEMHLDPKTVAAGLLHDVPDDTQRTLDDIEKEFGKEVSFLVEGVSKLGKLRYPKKGLEVKPLETRVEEPIDLRAENLRKMFFAMSEDLRVVLIKLADRLDNMKTLGALPPEKQQRIALETLEIFAPLANRLSMGEIKSQLEDLTFPYLYPKEYEWLQNNVKEKYEERHKHLEKVKPLLIKMLREANIKLIDVHSRPKHYWSLYQKLLRNDMDFDRIYDLIAVRVIVDDIKSCYEVLGAIHKSWKPLPGRIKDYIAAPKPNGYQALHTTVFCFVGKIIEVQVKTKKMHEEAEYGIAAHWAVKEGINLKTQTKKFAWVQQLRDWQKGVSKSKEFLESLKIDFFRNRIFVFTPKGDVIDLPEGACPIDFAYAVHTDIGSRCASAKVNGKIAPFSQSLKNWDVVEIIVDKNKKPSRDWLEFIKTSLARTRIKSWLKQEDRPENLKRGRELLNREFQQLQGKLFENIPQSKNEELLKAFPYKNLESLIVAVGEGEISSREIFKSLYRESEVFGPNQNKSRPRIHLKESPRDLGGISLAGETGIQIYLAKCCSPKPSQKIKAYISKDRGAAIHRIDCDDFISAKKKWPQKIVEASWEREEKSYYTVSLKIKARDRVELLRDFSSIISELGINILSCKAEPQPSGEPAILDTKVEISGLEELNKLFGRLKQVKGILDIKKV